MLHLARELLVSFSPRGAGWSGYSDKEKKWRGDCQRRRTRRLSRGIGCLKGVGGAEC